MNHKIVKGSNFKRKISAINFSSLRFTAILVSFFYLISIIIEINLRDFNPSNKYVELKMLRDSGRYVVPTVHLADRIFDGSGVDGLTATLAGISNANTLYCKESSFWTLYKSDKFGFNNPINRWDKKNKDATVFLGDSFIHGACVNPGESIVDYFNEKRHGINLAYGGTGSIAQYATLMEFKSELPNDLRYIIWGFYEGNDLIQDTANEIEWLKPYIDNAKYSQRYIDRIDDFNEAMAKKINEEVSRAEINKPIPYVSILKLHQLRLNINRFIYSRDRIDSEWHKINLNKSKKYYELSAGRVAEFAKSINAKVALLYIKSDIRYCKERFPNDFMVMREQELFVQSVAKKHKFHFIDSEDVINRDNYKNFYYYTNCENDSGSHFNPAGNKVISDLLIRKINH